MIIIMIIIIIIMVVTIIKNSKTKVVVGAYLFRGKKLVI